MCGVVIACFLPALSRHRHSPPLRMSENIPRCFGYEPASTFPFTQGHWQALHLGQEFRKPLSDATDDLSEPSSGSGSGVDSEPRPLVNLSTITISSVLRTPRTTRRRRRPCIIGQTTLLGRSSHREDDYYAGIAHADSTVVSTAMPSSIAPMSNAACMSAVGPAAQPSSTTPQHGQQHQPHVQGRLDGFQTAINLLMRRRFST
ncbi:hypothetical protein MRX96_054591, partial [Rhipicephalus microplus]